MKITIEQIKKIIKEEMDNILSETEDSFFEKLKLLMTSGEENYKSAAEVYENIKDQGMFNSHEEASLQAINNYAGAFYEFWSIKEEYLPLKRKRHTETPEEKKRRRKLSNLLDDAYDRMQFGKPELGLYEDEVHKRLVDSLSYDIYNMNQIS